MKSVFDRTGRELKKGDIVDVSMTGMFQGEIRGIVTSSLIAPGQPSVPPHIVVEVVIQYGIAPNGGVPNTYLIGRPEPLTENNLLDLAGNTRKTN